tara:strand:- start:3605 stop:3955 length:351 start_codon:yes stop_codon:yes gene_type:complete
MLSLLEKREERKMSLNNIIDFRVRDPQGNMVTYNRGDYVRQSGNIYVAMRETSGYDPRHGERGGWKIITTNRIEDFDYTNDAPKNPSEGDKWLDATSGKMFHRIRNTDGSGSWVEF